MHPCPRHISEEPRYGLKWPKRIAVTVNEGVGSGLAGIAVYLVLDFSHLVPFYVPLPLGLITAAIGLWTFGTLSRGRPGSYLWDIAARRGWVSNRPGTITRYQRYWCTADVILSPIGIWGRPADHLGPYEVQHIYLPPSGLRGRIPRSVNPPAQRNVSLSAVFAGKDTWSGKTRGTNGKTR